MLTWFFEGSSEMMSRGQRQGRGVTQPKMTKSGRESGAGLFGNKSTASDVAPHRRGRGIFSDD